MEYKKMKVCLVGAGIGDPELITVKGKRLLEKADVVIGDYLADERLLRYMNPKAKYIYAGKKAGNHTLSQREIESLLVKEAKKDQLVVRLKGGDPFVFGRGGEEIEALSKEGIPFEVVPGVTSAIAGPAYAGIPVTHRGISSSFAVVTGHEDPNKEKSSIHYDKLATAADTLIFLMGVKHIREISGKLIRYGRPADTPCAFIRWAGRPYEEVYVTTLEKAPEEVETKHIKPPAVFIVGGVVNLRETMKWYDNKPLFGKRIVVTRSASQASSLSEILAGWGADVISLPSIRVVEPPDNYRGLDEEIERLSTYSWIIFTSQNGVTHFFRRLFAKGLDSRALGHLKVAVIGCATGESLKKYGIVPDLVPHAFCAEGLAEAIEKELKAGDRILIPRALVARPYLGNHLRAKGFYVKETAAYETAEASENRDKFLDLLIEKAVDIITFTSSSTVKNFMHMIHGREEALKDISLAAIGPVTAGTLKEYGFEPDIVADTYTIPGLAEKIRKEVIKNEG